MKKSLLALCVIATLSTQAHEHHSHDDEHTHETDAHTHTDKVHTEAPAESHTADNVADDHAHEHVEMDNKATHEHKHDHEYAEADKATAHTHEYKHDDDYVGHIGAHVHGEAQLNIAIDQSTIGIALSSPAMNIIGFEYEPKSAEDIKTAKDALDKISHSELFTMNTGDCKLATTDINWQYKSAVLNEKEAHAHEHDKAHDHKETHSDITVDLGYLCQDIVALKQIDVQLFAQFPHFEKINVLWVSADKQGSAVLTKDQTVIDLDK